MILEGHGHIHFFTVCILYCFLPTIYILTWLFAHTGEKLYIRKILNTQYFYFYEKKISVQDNVSLWYVLASVLA